MIAAHQVNDSANLHAAAIEAEVNQIQALSIDELRKRWCAMFGTTPPRALSKDIIARMISYRIQEEAFGGLDRETIKLLNRLARGASSELSRHLKVGTVLIREYEGKRHTVTVAADGFLWEEQTYSSLSTIAQVITGTKWNGPRFFGLRLPSTSASAPVSAREATANPKPRRARSSLTASSQEACTDAQY
jgi:Protein of unknown function (DUF2924)